MFKKMPNKTCKTFHRNMQNMRNQGTSISCAAEGSLDKNAKKYHDLIFFKQSHFGERFKTKGQESSLAAEDGRTTTAGSFG